MYIKNELCRGVVNNNQAWKSIKNPYDSRESPSKEPENSLIKILKINFLNIME